MNQPQLTPRDDAHIPKSEKLHPVDKATMKEIEKLAADQSLAVATLAQGSAITAENSEEIVMLLTDLKDIMVKVCGHFSIPLPRSIQIAMEAKTYDPDAEDEGDDEEDDGEGEEA